MLIIKKKKSSYQQDWYRKNKTRIAERRKKHYAENAEYRQRQIEASAKYRRGERTPPAPAGIISLAETAKRVCVGKSTLRGWLRKQLINKEKLLPEPNVYKGQL